MPICSSPPDGEGSGCRQGEKNERAGREKKAMTKEYENGWWFGYCIGVLIGVVIGAVVLVVFVVR